jgi:hypothetical protein
MSTVQVYLINEGMMQLLVTKRKAKFLAFGLLQYAVCKTKSLTKLLSHVVFTRKCFESLYPIGELHRE